MSLEDSVFNVKYFGALGDGVQDDFPAFQRALAAIDALTGKPPGIDNRGAILLVPFGEYRLSQALRITRSMIIQGAGGIGNTLLRFFRKAGTDPDLPLAGIIVDMGFNDPTDPSKGFRADAQGTVIRDISIRTDTGFSPPKNGPRTAIADDDFLVKTSSGIVLYARARIENCYITGFEHDGIHINSSIGMGASPGSWQIENCILIGNGRHGLFVTGGQSNVGCAINLTCEDNFKWGVYDNSFLGNTYLMCHVEHNGHINAGPDDPIPDFGGAYRSVNPNARNVFLGCYAEGGQISILRFPACYIGGLHDGELREDPLDVRFPLFIHSEGQIELNELRLNGPLDTLVSHIRANAHVDPEKIDDLKASFILADASSGTDPNIPPKPLKIILPPPSDSRLGRLYTVKKVDPTTRVVTLSVAPGTAGSIDGNPEFDLVNQYSWVTLLFDGVNWNIVGRG